MQLDLTENNDSKFAMISVVIPAFNEEEYIADTINALKDQYSLQNLEMIVADNGSTDKTADIARYLNAKVLHIPVGTIAAVRNFGVKHSRGDILIFLDADVVITDKWRKHILDAVNSLVENPFQIIGSRCLPLSNTGFLNRYWYSRLSQYKANYINSGHLITTRKLFCLIGGFNESLETAEDYYFCLKAKEHSAIVIELPELEVVHRGYPETIFGFIKRERWHGREDVKSFASFKDSKIAWVAAFSLFIFVFVLLLAIAMSNIHYLIIFPMFMALITTCLTIYKFGFSKIDILLCTSVVFFLYLTGRTWALATRIGHCVVHR